MSSSPSKNPPATPSRRLPFYYGWVVVGVAFVTMGIGVNIRTSFSLMFPAILEEFKWSRGDTAAAFSFGFFVSALASPAIGSMIDRYGPRLVIPFGTNLVGIGLLLATLTTRPWHLYLTMGLMVVGGSVIFSYIGHSMFLPYWFERRRGLAIGIAFSGVGVGSILVLPWVQLVIEVAGWRLACLSLLGLLIVVVLPLNLMLQRHRPEDMGLLPDGDTAPEIQPDAGAEAGRESRAPETTESWTVRKAMRSAPFWWLCVGFFCALFSWYLVQVHQTKYLIEIGFDAQTAAFALGLVGFMGIVGQISLGYLSDRAGRELAWTVAALGFVACYAILLVMQSNPSTFLMYLMVGTQGVLGYGMASVFGAISADIFKGSSFASIFGLIGAASVLGGGAGPWAGGIIQDAVGSYAPAFWAGIAASLISIVCIWFAAPRRGSVR